MSLNDVLMKYDDVSAFSKEVAEHKTNFDTLLSDLDSLNGELNGSWKGYAAAEFKEAYEKLRPQLKRFSQLLLTYQTELNHAVADSSNTQNKSAKRIDSNLTLG